jgi:Flp pilus assembly protein TadD
VAPFYSVLLIPSNQYYLGATSKFQRSLALIQTYFGQGYERFQKADYDRAISDFTKAVKVNPRYAKAYNYRGIAYMKSGNKERACSDWKRACELGNCNNYKVAKGRGDCK